MASRVVDPVDTIWLNMDRPNNLMVIESLMMLERPVDWDRFIAVVQTRIADRYPVFSQRPVPSRIPGLLPHWEDVPDVVMEDHIIRATLPAPGDDVALQDYVNRFISSPLRRDRPLWEMHLIDGYGEGSAVYSRFHHALADGVALVQVLLSLTDPTPDADLTLVPPAEEAQHSRWDTAVQLAEESVLQLPGLLDVSRVGAAARLARQTTRIATKLLVTTNPPTAIAGQPGRVKRVLWSEPLPFDDVREVAHRTGTTVNDVLMAALAGALHHYLTENDGGAVDVPTMVPVNVRPLDEPLPAELGNKFALVLVKLPSALDTAFARLAETKRRMDEIKHSPEAVLTFGLIRGIGLTGPTLERYLVNFFAREASGVTTNVPGPREPRYAAGTRITGVLGWAPESGSQTLGTSIFTYAGHVRLGLKVDVARIEKPEALLQAFVDEVETLGQLGGRPRPRRRRRA